MALDPSHATWFPFPIANFHFGRGEYEEALATAQKIDVPGDFWRPVFLAAIYAELDRPSEADSAVQELAGLFPGFNTETLIEEWQKWRRSEDSIRHWVSALRKAGLPE